MAAQWSRTVNTFENATRKSYRKANTVGMFTDQALSGVSGGALVALRDYYRPRYTAYKTTYEAWVAMGAQGEGATLSLHDAEALIDHDVDDWEFTVMGTYRKGTPGYKVLFPDGISALKRGTREQRTTTLHTFSENLGLTPTLAPLKSLVDARIGQLSAAADDQGTKKGAAKSDSSSVEAARLALCTALFYVLGGLMQVYADTPAAIDGYFDVETLRDIPQTHFSGAVHMGGEPVFITERTLPSDAAMTLANDGPTDLLFYFSNSKTGGVPSQGIAIPAAVGQTLQTTAGAMGASAANRFMMVTDNNPDVDGHYTVDF